MGDCPSCCEACAILPSQRTVVAGTEPEPFALRNLFAIGTICVTTREQRPCWKCEHSHMEDGWHDFRRFFVQSDDCDTAYLQLGFLVAHDFLRATCRKAANIDDTMVVRIYMVPYDLSGVQGRLKVRKPKVLDLAREYLGTLLPNVSNNVETWQGNVSSDTSLSLFMPPMHDIRTLAEIYAEVPSPLMASIPGDFASRRLSDYEDSLKCLGMRSELLFYQRRSVSTMLLKERQRGRSIPDPLYSAVNSVDLRKTFFLQPGTLELVREQPMVEAPCGGILCEELGTGKTVICLALILSTLQELSAPQSSMQDMDPIVLTPLSLRHFNTAQHISLRKSLSIRHGSSDSHDIVPSLSELLLHKISTDPAACRAESNSQSNTKASASALIDDRFSHHLKSNHPFYIHADPVPVQTRISNRNTSAKGYRKMYLTSATLIVLPVNLLGQWYSEIHKHCDDLLRVLVLRPNVTMPSARDLATDFDIVLVSYRYLAGEKGDLKKFDVRKLCQCAEFHDLRVPDCSCEGPSPDASSLLQVRWKRLIIDEGHVSAKPATKTIDFLTQKLSAECRWIVTGTPTTNLLGLGELADADSEVTDTEETADDNTDSGEAVAGRKSRQWDSSDRVDMRNLTAMIAHFVGFLPFKDATLTRECFIQPLFSEGGPRPGAISVLCRVMELTMIRHRYADVEQEIKLPPVLHEHVLLDLDELALRSYNVLQAVIAINAVESDRVDRDYFFHPKNVEYLQLAIANLSQFLFWAINDSLETLDELSSRADKSIQRMIDEGRSAEDIALIREAFRQSTLAAADKTWRLAQSHEDVPYRVSNIHTGILTSWTRMGVEEGGREQQTHGYIDCDRLTALKHLAIRYPLRDEVFFVEKGQERVAQDQQFRENYKEGRKRQKEPNKSSNLLHSSDHGKAEAASKKATQTHTLNAMKKDLVETLSRMDSESGSATGIGIEDMTEANAMPSSTLLSSSILAGTRIGSSASSKLNYLLADILHHSSTEKFLVFSDSPLTLAHVAEALELVGIKFLRYTTQIRPKDREQLVTTFETSETYRVFLMELKHGARGLNLVSASRIIFCEPVWQADVESQAIKRAHRIGQTKTITVKTLCIRDTYEEMMLIRKNALKNSQDRVPKVLEETGIRHFIANPKFLQQTDQNTPLDLPLLPILPEPTSSENDMDVDVSEKSGLSVRFAQPGASHLEHLPKRRRVVMAGDLDPGQNPESFSSSSQSGFRFEENEVAGASSPRKRLFITIKKPRFDC